VEVLSELPLVVAYLASHNLRSGGLPPPRI
jgi:hypothetical protein